MRTAVLCYGPEFACTENLTRAFALRGDVQLISAQEADSWRGYDAGLVLGSEENLEQARIIADAADLLVIGDAVSFCCLGRIGGINWIKWAKKKKLMAFFGDTAYWKHPEYYEGMCKAVGIKRIFLLPDLMPLAGMRAIPLHHPMPLLAGEKSEMLTVAHSPGRDGKAIAKGTAQIEDAIRLLRADEIEFDYVRIMYQTIKECLKIKSAAHIFIDQVPPPGWPRGLGRSGLEGMAVGAVVLSDIYPAENLRRYFKMPPVVRVSNVDDLYNELKSLLTNEERRQQLQEKSRQWIAETTAFEPWLEYVERWL